MALAADIHFERISFFSRTGFEGRTARAGDSDLVIIGMYIGFHAFTSLCVLSFKMLNYYISFPKASQTIFACIENFFCAEGANAIKMVKSRILCRAAGMKASKKLLYLLFKVAFLMLSLF